MADDDTPACTFPLPPLMLHSLDRFQYLVTVNTPPNSCESDELRSIIFDSGTTLSEHKNMLCKAISTVAALEKRIMEVGSVLQNAKNIAHPIRSIPNEILSMIFAQCANAHLLDSRYEKDSLSTARAPWHLSYVCQRWRNLVLSSPSLWSSPSFNFALYAKSPPRRIIYLATLYMERSARLPLSVEFISNYTRQLCNHPLTFVIEATTLRWKTVILDCPLPTLRFFSGCIFPLLESVEIGSRFFDDDEEQGPQITTLSSLPKLNRLIAAREEVFDMVQMPWTHIVFYQCDFHAFQEDHFTALRQMTSLQSLTVTLESEAAIAAPDIVVLPRLMYLQICIDDSAVLDGFLASLSMPSLVQLHLRYHLGIDPPVFPRVHPDFPHVDSLHICANLVKRDAELIAFLSIMSGVEKLQVSWGLMTDGLVRSLTPSSIGTNAALLPGLRVLDIHRSWLFYPPDSSLDDVNNVFSTMVLWRASSQQPGARLEELRVASDWRDDNDPTSPEDNLRWDQVCAAVSVVYLEYDGEVE